MNYIMFTVRFESLGFDVVSIKCSIVPILEQSPVQYFRYFISYTVVNKSISEDSQMDLNTKLQNILVKSEYHTVNASFAKYSLFVPDFIVLAFPYQSLSVPDFSFSIFSTFYS
ncbi:unnamed protein product [Schistosoma rodhaini]|uniref:Uncharacterized protein n=1 Tax=Schistosoma rodhaini TaxID=6188 RepID=A0AA85FF68_9TREM|nr:unnamed protein product [Schistosoma rodhaini]